MPAYTFVSKDLLNTAVLPTESQNWTSYSTSTNSSVLVPKLTILTPSATRNTYGAALDGAIDWQNESLIIGGMSTKLKNLKRRPSRKSGGAREWTWKGERFTVKYHASTDKWTAKSGSPAHPDDAIFAVRKHRILKADDPATMTLSENLSAQDTVFLILVMIYSETRRQERKERVAVAIAG
ncbi:hypothetical protein FPV67DRAFT_7752 [Lyophyllum atratum]|nr:hypothetical protein FPV67DRAFT_7752 [Lyophyllum atratum]